MTTTLLQRSLCVAPMMRYSHKHNRQLWRLLSPSALLYTEMITAPALVYGNPERLLTFPSFQSPLALQLGGNSEKMLKQAAQIGTSFGYDEINLNCGCPSHRVQNGAFGACLMKNPEKVADLVAAMKSVTPLPVTVKCRLGVDEMDTETSLDYFIDTVSQAGADVFIIHARKAWLQGINPAQNRCRPPLDYVRVHRLKKKFPTRTIILNGGLNTLDDVLPHQTAVDGVMLGRAICRQPHLLASLSQHFFQHSIIPRQQVLQAFLSYVRTLPPKEYRSAITCLARFFHGTAGSKYWRRLLGETPLRAMQELEHQCNAV